MGLLGKTLFSPRQLVGVAIEAPRPKLIARDIYPTRPAATQTGFVFEVDKERANQRIPKNYKNPPMGRAPRLSLKANQDRTYVCEQRAIEHLVHDNEFRNAEVESRPAINGVAAALARVELIQEWEFKQHLIDHFTVANGHSGGPVGYAWNNYTNGDPLKNIRDQIEAIYATTGVWCNGFGLGRKVLSALANHPDVIDRVKHTFQIALQGTSIDQQASFLKSLLMIDYVYVAEADMINISDTDEPDLRPIWGEDCMLFRSEPLQVGCQATGCIPVWNNMTNGGGVTAGWRAIEDYEKRESTSIYRMEGYYDITTLTLNGYLFRNVLTPPTP